MCIQTRVGHTDRKSAKHFWLRKPHKFFLCSWQGSNLGSWNPLDPEADALPIEPPRHPLLQDHHSPLVTRPSHNIQKISWQIFTIFLSNNWPVTVKRHTYQKCAHCFVLSYNKKKEVTIISFFPTLAVTSAVDLFSLLTTKGDGLNW